VVSADCLQGLPVDYPLFTADTVSVKDATGATIEQRVEAKTTEDGKPYVIVEMVKTKGETTTKTILRWEPGKPWWTQMDQYRNGEHIIHAELVLGDTPADGKPPAAPADRK
jgi:hypothetical protein